MPLFRTIVPTTRLLLSNSGKEEKSNKIENACCKKYNEKENSTLICHPNIQEINVLRMKCKIYNTSELGK
jgi:hypothetical protein